LPYQKGTVLNEKPLSDEYNRQKNMLTYQILSDILYSGVGIFKEAHSKILFKQAKAKKIKEECIMRTFKKALAVVLATSMIASAVPASAAVKPKLISKKTMTAGKKGRAMTAKKVKKYKKAGYTLKFASSKKAVAKINSKTGVIKAKKAGKSNITCKFVKAGKKTVTKKMKLTVKAKATTDDSVSTSLSATQTGQKEITVTGSGITADTLKVTKGSTEVAIETPEVSADGTKAIIPTSGKLAEATYTVTVGEASVDVACVTSEPTSIEVGDKISATEKITNYNQQYDGKFTFVVRNQWGEDVTKTVSPQINVNGVSATPTKNVNGEGYVVVAPGVIYPQTMTLGSSTITANIFDTTYPAINTSKALVVSDVASTKSITFTEIYNVDGEELVARADGTFVYLFELETVDGVKIIDTKDSIIKDGSINIYVNPGMTNLDTTYTKEDIIQVEKMDGTTSLGIELKVAAGKELAAGSASIQMMDLTSGVQGTGNIEIGDGTVVKTFSAAAEGTVVAGEENEFSFTATDAAGNAVTDLTSLNAISKPDTFRFQKEGTEVKLIYTAPAGVKGPQYATFTTENYTSTVSVNFTVMAEARPTSIIGIRDAGKGALVGKTEEYQLKNLVFEDQYGRTMPKLAVEAKLAKGDTTNGAYKVAVVNDSSNTANVKLNGTDATAVAISAAAEKVTVDAVNAATTKLTFKLVKAVADADGNTDIKFENVIDQYDRIINNVSNNSEYSINFLGANESQVTSYTVEAPDMLYANGAELGEAYTAEVEVYGKVGSTNVAIDDFDITFQEADDLIEGKAQDGISATGAFITGTVNTDKWYNATGSSKITSAKRVMEVNINGSNPQTIEKEITLSAASPVAKNAYFLDEDGNEVNFMEVGNAVRPVLNSVYVVDQYGVDTGDDEYVANTSKVDLDAAKLTVSEINAASKTATVSANGTNAPTLSGFAVGDTFTLKITFQGGYTKTISCSYVG
jgi:hypothetical protein